MIRFIRFKKSLYLLSQNLLTLIVKENLSVKLTHLPLQYYYCIHFQHRQEHMHIHTHTRAIYFI